MKKLFLFLVLVLWCVPAMAVNYCSDASAVGCWLMNAEANPTVDSSSAGKDMGYDGSPSFVTTAKFGGGYTCSGEPSGTFYRDGGYNFASTGFTLLGYLKTTSSSAPAASEMLMSNNDDGGSLRAYDTRNSGPRFSMISSGWKELTSSTSIYNQTWTHLVGVYTGSKMYIYINGLLDAQMDASGDPSDKTGASFQLCKVSSTNTLNASIDDVAVFSRALSSTEINDIKDNGLVGASGPSSHVTTLRNSIWRNAVLR